MTELVFILDRSGSMSGLEKDTIGGFNSMIERQKRESGTAFVTTVLFDGEVSIIHDRLPLSEVPPLTEKEYFTRGSTALMDAVGSSIRHISSIHKYARKEDIPEKTVFFITTDGYENSSKSYDRNKVRSMIEEKRKIQGWEFVFIGANIDARSEAASYGIDPAMAVDYISDKEGTALNYEVMSDMVRCFTAQKSLPMDWKKRIENRNSHK